MSAIRIRSWALSAEYIDVIGIVDAGQLGVNAEKVYEMSRLDRNMIENLLSMSFNEIS